MREVDSECALAHNEGVCEERKNQRVLKFRTWTKLNMMKTHKSGKEQVCEFEARIDGQNLRLICSSHINDAIKRNHLIPPNQMDSDRRGMLIGGER